MKLLIFLSLFSFNLIAAECDLEISSQATTLATTFDPQGCLVNVGHRQLTLSFTQADARSNVCKNCISPLVKDKVVKRIPNPIHKNQFITAAFSELKKGVSQTMLELVSLRSSLEVSIDGEDIAKSCDLNKISNFPACSKVPGLKGEMEVIQRSLAGEFASYYDKTIVNEGLMVKSPNPACSIDDKDLLLVKNRYIESILPTIVAALKKVKTTPDDLSFIYDFNSEIEILNKDSKIDPLMIHGHPLIASLLANPDALKAFLLKSKPNSSLAVLRENLYGKDGSKAYSERLKKKCISYVETFQQTICGEEVENYNISVDSKVALESIIDAPISLHESKIEKLKLGMLDYCQDDFSKNLKTVSFSVIKEVLSKGIPEADKDLPYSKFKVEAYKGQVETQRDALCKIESKEQECIVGTEMCGLYNFWKSTQDKDSTEFKLLTAHDPNIDKILRALIGEPKGISPKIRTVLIDQGIYPDPITKKYAVSDLPERKTDFYKTDIAAQNNVLSVPSQSAAAKATTKTSGSPKQAAQIASTVAYATDSPAVANMNTTNPTKESEASIRDDLQRKILDRLDNQISAKQIEAMVEKAYNKGRSTPMTPQQVTEKTKELLEEIPNEATGSNGNISGTIGGKASVARDQAKEKQAAKQLGFLKAKYGIDPNAPAKMAAGKSASASDENLQVVAVNGASELKIVVDDIKNIKGQEIAKLIESETPFILKIGKVSYKVSFADNKVKITTPEGMIRNPASITKLEEYITSLAGRNTADPSMAKNKKLYKELQKVNYKE